MVKSVLQTIENSKHAEASDATLRRFLGYHIKRVSNIVQADLADVLKPLELRMITFTSLVLIVDNPGLSQTKLAQVMDVERPNLVMIVDELEQLNLIVRKRIPTDRRTYALTATLAGQKLYKKAIAAVQMHEDKLFAALDKKSQKTVVRALDLVREQAGKG